MNNRDTAEHIFLAGIKGVLPGTIIHDLFSVRGSILKIGYHSYDLDKFEHIYIIGAGKASAALGHYVGTFLGSRISGGYIVTKYGNYCRLDRIEVSEAGHPVPDQNSFLAADEIRKIAGSADENDLVICIWSGGGSALMADYPDGSSPTEMMFLNDMLVRCGATIHEINVVRRHLSQVKGGLLSRHIWPATSVTLYLSDVIGDQPETVASGPTSPGNSTYADALNVIRKYGLFDDTPLSLLKYLNEGVQGLHPDLPERGDQIFSRSVTILAGNNRNALQASRREAEKMGYTAVIIPDNLAGDSGEACTFIINTIHKYREDDSLKKPVCLLFGGETTVRVSGDGVGGRNQHLALQAALRIQDIPGITFLAAGTDGNDGTGDMAGAVVDSETIHDALSMNADPGKYLENFDSFNFFRNVGGHLYTGPTMTNVMDIAIAIIE